MWQRQPETASGGFALAGYALLAAATVAAGTPVAFDEATRTATVLKTAKLAANATNVATTYNVEKGHHFKVGDNFGAVIGGKAYPITAIDTSNANYDVFTVGTTLGVALVAGDALFQSSATGASAAALMVTPNGLVYEGITVEENAPLSAVIRGTVYERRIPAIPSAVKSGIPNIIFSKSF
ncbi:hypothetical protein GCM10023184_18460 [Flaviaesturariibacter amylovorans]|uniref:Uncharacterized protein n=1 Tax=Flaviaesturariibacter amylovorans TaxID=1084520 RepID=A0ABP8GR95_9BACT